MFKMVTSAADLICPRMSLIPDAVDGIVIVELIVASGSALASQVTLLERLMQALMRFSNTLGVARIFVVSMTKAFEPVICPNDNEQIVRVNNRNVAKVSERRKVRHAHLMSIPEAAKHGIAVLRRKN
jgi:hypothetical protein